MNRLLYDAHIDEVGVIVTEYVDGFCKIAILGSPDLRILPGSEILFLTPPLPPLGEGGDATESVPPSEGGGEAAGVATLFEGGVGEAAGGSRVYGVIGALPPHLADGSENKIIAPDDLFVDTGGVAVPVGTPGVFKQLTVNSEQLTITEVGRELNGSLFSAKALDNRASCAVLLDVLKRLDGEKLNVDLSFLFSVQEEVGLRGAQVGALNSGADYAVVVDVTFGQSADTKGHEAFELGKGPTIGVGPNMNRKFTERLKAVADKRGIPYQIEVLPGNSGTNSAVIQLAGQGIATALVSIPLRYMHTPVETLDIRDLRYASDLLYWLALEWEQ